MVGKKKRGHPDVEELLQRPWCYYCERDFDDLKILISHQKAKHFKCERCGRRLNTAGGLSVHMNQVHKETLTSVDNSLPNRQGLEVEIFGMEGIPEDVVQAHNQRIITGFYQAEAERRAATGNPGPGNNSNQVGAPKKPKFESPADIKKRLAEHKARKAEQAANGGSGDNTPLADTPIANSPGAFNGSPYAPPGASYGNAQGAGFGTYQEPYAQPAATYSQSFPQPAFSGPPGAQSQYAPPQPYAQQSFPPGYQPPPQTYPAAPGQFNAGSPPGSFNANYNAPPPSYTPPGAGGLPNRPPTLPPAPGLPQRPSFGAPPVAPFQMQQMHQGAANSPYPGQQQSSWGGNNWNGQDNSAMSSAPPPQGYNGGYATNAPGTDGNSQDGDDIDAMIRAIESGQKVATKLPAQTTSAEPTPTPAPETEQVGTSEKKSKKDKPIRMVYSDVEFSPEERMSKMHRYAFIPEEKTETALVEEITMGIAGTVEA